MRNVRGSEKRRLSGWKVMSLVAFAGLLITWFYLTLIDVGYSSMSISHKATLSMVQKATLLYAFDNDNVFPAATSMKTLRALLPENTTSGSVFTSNSRVHSTPQFNFNLAGVSTSLPPYPGSKQTNSHEVIAWHIEMFKGPGRIVIVTADGSPRVLEPDEREEFQKLLAPQFDRKGAKLFPPDHLADRDPLRIKN